MSIETNQPKEIISEEKAPAYFNAFYDLKFEFSKEDLLSFIAEAHKNTYAAPKEIRARHKCEKPILPEHKDYHYKRGDWEYHDSYAGSIWAPGKEVVFFKGKPVWCMSYQGQCLNYRNELFFEQQVFPFLKKTLRNTDESMPFRGPKEFKEGDFRYSFRIDGNYDSFKGRERIFHHVQEIFFQDVIGGLIK